MLRSLQKIIRGNIACKSDTLPQSSLVDVWYSGRLEIKRSRVQISIAATVNKYQLSVPSLWGQLMSTSKNWGVKMHTIPSFIGWMFLNESTTNSVCSCTDASTTKLLGTRWTTAHQYPTLPIVNGYVLPVVMKSLFHGTGSVPMDVGHLPLLARLSLELFARGHA